MGFRLRRHAENPALKTHPSQARNHLFPTASEAWAQNACSVYFGGDAALRTKRMFNMTSYKLHLEAAW